MGCHSFLQHIPHPDEDIHYSPISSCLRRQSDSLRLLGRNRAGQSVWLGDCYHSNFDLQTCIGIVDYESRCPRHQQAIFVVLQCGHEYLYRSNYSRLTNASPISTEATKKAEDWLDVHLCFGWIVRIWLSNYQIVCAYISL